MELENNAGAFSISSISEKEANDRNGYAIRGLLEEILDRDNMNRAYKRVKKNKGSHGIDGMTVDELLLLLRENRDQIKKSIHSQACQKDRNTKARRGDKVVRYTNSIR